MGFYIWYNRKIEVQRPDIVIVNKKNKSRKTVAIAVPVDFRVREKDVEKI